MKNLFNRFVREESGQDIIEYALLAAFISIVAWPILQAIGRDVKTICTPRRRQAGRPTGAAAAASPVVSDPRADRRSGRQDSIVACRGFCPDVSHCRGVSRTSSIDTAQICY